MLPGLPRCLADPEVGNTPANSPFTNTENVCGSPPPVRFSTFTNTRGGVADTDSGASASSPGPAGVLTGTFAVTVRRRPSRTGPSVAPTISGTGASSAAPPGLSIRPRVPPDRQWIPDMSSVLV